MQKTKTPEDFFKSLMSCLFSPIITWPSYEDMVPKEFLEEVRIERMLNNMKALKNNEENEEATDIEALIYLHTASLANPLAHEWCEIYFYLFKEYLKRKNKEIPEDLDFVKNAEINDFQKKLLRDLKRWIWNVQNKHFNNKYKNQLITTTKEVNIETIEKQKKLLDFLNGGKNEL